MCGCRIHSVSVETQYILAPKWTYWKDFLIFCRPTWMSADKKWAYFYYVLLCIVFIEMNRIENDTKRIIHLNRYSNSNIIFRKIMFVLGLKNWSLKLKMHHFLSLWLKSSYKVSKSSLSRFIWVEISIKFQLKHYEIPKPSALQLLFQYHGCQFVTLLALGGNADFIFGHKKNSVAI